MTQIQEEGNTQLIKMDRTSGRVLFNHVPGFGWACS